MAFAMAASTMASFLALFNAFACAFFLIDFTSIADVVFFLSTLAAGTTGAGCIFIGFGTDAALAVLALPLLPRAAFAVLAIWARAALACFASALSSSLFTFFSALAAAVFGFLAFGFLAFGFFAAGFFAAGFLAAGFFAALETFLVA